MHNNAELNLIMQTKNYYANTQSITKECSRIPDEWLWTIFLKIPLDYELRCHYDPLG